MIPTQWRTLFIHIALWGLFAFVLLFYHPLSWEVELPTVFWIRQMLHVVFFLTLFYTNYLLAVPKLLFKGRIGQYVWWMLSMIVVALLFSYFTEEFLQVRQKMEDALRVSHTRKRDWLDGFMLTTSLLVLGISTAIAAVQRWQRDSRLNEEFKRQQVEAELAYLKSQINPHFFFNTLNSIYALSFTDVTVAREALHTLSRMMRYLLYETPRNESSLHKEINFIKDHVALMRLRLHDNMRIVLEYPELDGDRLIAPMLLLPFVENAFKHGVSTTQKGTITISLTLQGDQLTFHVVNPIHREEKSAFSLDGGIGLVNTRRRLELLYPEKHKLEIKEDKQNGIYSVHLTITLS